MMDMKLLARRLAGVDLSDIAAKQAEVIERIAAIDEAVERGREKSIELTQRLSDIRSAKRDGRDEADALMSGAPISTVADTEDRIRGERDAIQSGMKTLAVDAEELRHQRTGLQQQARQRLSGAISDMMAELQTEAEQLAGRLARIYVDVETLEHATGSRDAAELSLSLDYLLNGAAAGRLIPRNFLFASPELVAVLEKNIASVRTAGAFIAAKHRSSMM